MAREMSGDEWRAFVSEGTRTAKLATVRPDGAPHVAPVWFVLDGEDLVFTTAATTVKGRNLAHQPRTSLCVDDERPPFSFVLLSGRVVTSDDPDELLTWSTRIGGRYMGADRAEEFGRRNGVPGELLCRLTPDRIVAQAAISD